MMKYSKMAEVQHLPGDKIHDGIAAWNGYSLNAEHLWQDQQASRIVQRGELWKFWQDITCILLTVKDDLVCRISGIYCTPCECGTVYNGQMGAPSRWDVRNMHHTAIPTSLQYESLTSRQLWITIHDSMVVARMTAYFNQLLKCVRSESSTFSHCSNSPGSLNSIEKSQNARYKYFSTSACSNK